MFLVYLFEIFIQQNLCRWLLRSETFVAKTALCGRFCHCDQIRGRPTQRLHPKQWPHRTCLVCQVLVGKKMALLRFVLDQSLLLLWRGRSRNNSSRNGQSVWKICSKLLDNVALPKTPLKSRRSFGKSWLCICPEPFLIPLRNPCCIAWRKVMKIFAWLVHSVLRAVRIQEHVVAFAKSISKKHSRRSIACNSSISCLLLEPWMLGSGLRCS